MGDSVLCMVATSGEDGDRGGCVMSGNGEGGNPVRGEVVQGKCMVSVG